MCTVEDLRGTTIAKIPHSEGLYHVLAVDQNTYGHTAAAAAEKMSINEAHRKLGHISSVAIRHAVSKGFITGINLDKTSNPP